MLTLTVGGTQVPFTSFDFSGGEVQVRIQAPQALADEITITAHLRSPRDVMELVMLSHAANYHFSPLRMHLVCPYFPYARQDRVCYPGEAPSAFAFSKILNMLNFNSVTVWDAHSVRAVAGVKNIRNVEVDVLFQRIAACFGDVTVVAPDKGAVNRARSIKRLLDVPDMLCAEKIRDPDTGDITGIDVPDIKHIGADDFLMVDDICDGGRTFIELAKVLRPFTDGRILLYVTHGIFSKGFDVFRGVIDHIYTPNSFVDDPPADLVTCIEVS